MTKVVKATKLIRHGISGKCDKSVSSNRTFRGTCSLIYPWSLNVRFMALDLVIIVMCNVTARLSHCIGFDIDFPIKGNLICL